MFYSLQQRYRQNPDILAITLCFLCGVLRGVGSALNDLQGKDEDAAEFSLLAVAGAVGFMKSTNNFDAKAIAMLTGIMAGKFATLWGCEPATVECYRLRKFN